MFSVIIPSKQPGNLIQCVQAIEAYQPGADVIVIDDGAKEGASHLKVRWIAGIYPFIFARNVNLGIEAADTNDVILLNDDARLMTPNGFSILAEAGKDHGITSAAIDGDVGNLRQQRHWTGTRVESDKAMAFVCVFIPRKVLDQVGLLDDRFIGYGCEDTDYCQRVVLAGLNLAVCDDCIVEHRSLHSTFRHGRDYRADLELSRDIYREKYKLPPGQINLFR